MKDSSSGDGKWGRESVGKSVTVGTTIVGPRPTAHGHGHAKVPCGIEALLKKASVDPEFREILLNKRADAARDIDLGLSPAEAAVLNGIPRSHIEKVIRNTTVPDEQRRVFLGKVGAAMAAMLGLGLTGCTFQGIRPDDPRVRRPTPVPQGTRPDDPDPQPKRPSRGQSEDERPKDRPNDTGADDQEE
jgi:hypothetical protein